MGGGASYVRIEETRGREKARDTKERRRVSYAIQLTLLFANFVRAKPSSLTLDPVAEEAVENDVEGEEGDRIADEDLGPKGPVVEGDVTRMTGPGVDAGPDQGVLWCLLVYYEVGEV